MQVVVGVQVPELGLAEAGLVVAQEEVDGALLLIIVPAVVDGAAEADELVAHARRRLPVPALVLEHRCMRAAAPVLLTQEKYSISKHDAVSRLLHRMCVEKRLLTQG